MAQTEQLVPAAEFQALPLGFIVAAPLKAAVEAQAIAAETTRNFIESMMTGGNNKRPITVEFSTKMKDVDADGKESSQEVNVSAPLLSMLPVPHLRIDSVTTHFKYEISAVNKALEEKAASGTAKASTGGLLSPWVKASLTGSVSSKSSQESVMNRSGVLEITVNASESPIPEGLAKILGILSNSIIVGKVEKPK